MVEANSDPNVVTAVIRRETQEAAAARAAESAAAAVQRVQQNPVERQSAPNEVAVQEPSQPVAPVREVISSGMSQILIAAVIVVVLLFVWIAERRGRREGE